MESSYHYAEFTMPVGCKVRKDVEKYRKIKPESDAERTARLASEKIRRERREQNRQAEELRLRREAEEKALDDLRQETKNRNDALKLEKEKSYKRAMMPQPSLKEKLAQAELDREMKLKEKLDEADPPGYFAIVAKLKKEKEDMEAEQVVLY